LVNPSSSISVEGQGVLYAVNCNCFDPITALKSFNATVIDIPQSYVHGNVIEGRITAYLPAESSSSKIDMGLGVVQECTWEMSLGTGGC
jgi:hypothetical protein